MSKSKKLLIVMIIIVLFVLVGVGGYFYFQRSHEKKEDNTTEEKDTKKNQKKEGEEKEIEITLSNNPSFASAALEAQFSALTEMGEEIYDSNQYSSYPKKKDAYFISLAELSSDFGYDTSIFRGDDGTLCDQNLSGIYFDIDHKINSQYDAGTKPVIPILIGCSKAEIKANN